ncbi:MAG: hypothetical protein PHU85_19680 [Phycisphaerae bacterium]|nr:hypothetical protein [Phycisphaerae bacterium]
MKTATRSAALLLAMFVPLAIGGCDWPGPSAGGGDNTFASRGGEQGRVQLTASQRQSGAAHEVRQFARAGDFARARKLLADQLAKAADSIDSLWWRCQELYVLQCEDRPADRAELAAILADEPAARQKRFCLSSGWDELFNACVQGGRRDRAVRLLADREGALLADREDTRYWRRQMLELRDQARQAGDRELVAAIDREVPAGASASAALPIATQPDRSILPR